MTPRAISDSHERQPLSALTSRLRAGSRRITGPRKAILQILGRHPHPLTNRQILAALPKGQCNLATVYRAMHLLGALGMVKRYDFGDGTARFELTPEKGDAHHHHLVCTSCSEVVEIQDCFPDELEARIASRNGFKAVTHKLEFFGICPDCQSASKKD